MKFTAITCTGDRPAAFALCEKYLGRQTVKPAQMIVLDDGETPTVCTLGQEYHYWPEMRGRGSMVRKLRRALADGLIKGDAISFFEDDDWFQPDWLEFCARGLLLNVLFGEGRALYYTVQGRFWFEHVNMRHASLCSSVIRREGFAWLEQQCNISDGPFLDERLWFRAPFATRVADPYREMARLRRTVGIKAMPGRTGYGGGHRGRDRSAVDDPELKKLRSLIGSDADAYAQYYDPSYALRVPDEKNGHLPLPPSTKKTARELHEEWRAKNPRQLPHA